MREADGRAMGAALTVWGVVAARDLARPRPRARPGATRREVAGVTLCGLLRLDGADVRRSTLTAMLASSSLGLPAARGVHLDGPFGVVTAASAMGGPIPPIVVDDSGLIVVVLPARGHLRLAAAARDEVAMAHGVAAAYREAGEQCLRRLPSDRLVLIWDPGVRRLLITRTGRHAVDLLTWSDGRHVAFGTEPAHLVAAFRAPTVSPGFDGTDTRLPVRPPVALVDARRQDGGRAGAALGGAPGLVGTGRPRRPVHRLAAGEGISVSAGASRGAQRSSRPASLRLVPRPPSLTASDGTDRGRVSQD
jgi:hypothetical protein